MSILNLFQTKIINKRHYSILFSILLCIILELVACGSSDGLQTITTITEQETTKIPVASNTIVPSSQPTTTTTTIQTLTLDPTLDPTVFYVAYIVIDPKQSTIAAGESQVFTVTAHDYEGNSYDITRDCDFIIKREAGGRWEFNKYISSNIGIWEVHADYWNPISGTEFWRDSAVLMVN